MDALILNGARDGEDALAGVQEALSATLQAAHWRVDALELRRLELAACDGCRACWTRTPGVCGIDDAGREVARHVAQCHLLALVTPLTFGGYSSTLKRALDRLLPLVTPVLTRVRGEARYAPRYERYPMLLAVAVAPSVDGEAKEAFRDLVERNARNFHSPSHESLVVEGSARPSDLRGALRRAVARLEGVA
jgi:hypothetical protein